ALGRALRFTRYISAHLGHGLRRDRRFPPLHSPRRGDRRAGFPGLETPERAALSVRSGLSNTSPSLAGTGVAANDPFRKHCSGVSPRVVQIWQEDLSIRI